jgi:ABC-type transport system involved in cytochrome c biogenesis permease subunit
VGRRPFDRQARREAAGFLKVRLGALGWILLLGIPALFLWLFVREPGDFGSPWGLLAAVPFALVGWLLVRVTGEGRAQEFKIIGWFYLLAPTAFVAFLFFADRDALGEGATVDWTFFALVTAVGGLLLSLAYRR